jgi:hypothetical protein
MAHAPPARAGVRAETDLAAAADEQRASARRLTAPAWLPHPCQSNSAGLSTPIHAKQSPVPPRSSGPALETHPRRWDTGAMSTYPIDIAPSVLDVAALMRARTKDSNGIEVGTFNDDTRPTSARCSR